ncbi:MAG: flagellar biosynthetic protein FliR [Candidatus Eremiobacteraeota bacterium]|nr:flagellar biosynthetic protein FliR [Candidatus Eremiobacteraeota bacterium]
MLSVFGLTSGQFETLLLIMVRVTVIMMIIPVFSAKEIPQLARIGLGMLITFVIFKTVTPIAPLADLYELLAGIVSQAMIGLVFGFISYLVFMGIQLAGEILDIQIGFAVANVINPLTQTNVTVIGEFELTLASLIYLISNSHHLLLQGVAGSFNLLQLPYVHLDPSVAGNIMVFFTQSTLIIFKIAAPAAISLFIVNIALGLMARVAPQMNVFVVGFPLQIGIGLLMIAVSLPLIGSVVPNLYEGVPQQLDTVMRGMVVPSPSPHP